MTTVRETNFPCRVRDFEGGCGYVPNRGERGVESPLDCMEMLPPQPDYAASIPESAGLELLRERASSANSRRKKEIAPDRSAAHPDTPATRPP